MRGRSGKRIVAMAMAAVMMGTLIPMGMSANTAQAAETEGNLLQIWFDEPVSKGTVLAGMAGSFNTTEEDNRWQQLTLPIANGSIGANVYGEVSKEHLTFNEKTLWNGGPSDGRPNYNGGNLTTAANGQSMAAVFNGVQDLYAQGNDTEASSLANYLVGDSNGYGAYQSWGDIYIDYGFANENATNYSRNLDLLNSVSNVDFTKDGTDYHREYFVSYPDQVLAIRLTADGDDKMNLNITFPIDNAENVSAYNLGKNVTTTASGNRLTVAGQMQDNQLMLNGQILVANAGSGTVTPGADGESLDVINATEVVIYVAADTNYADEYPVYRTEDTVATLNARVKGLVDAAASKGYDAVMASHQADYKEIFNRVSLNLGQNEVVPSATTDALLSGYKAGSISEAERRGLETILFQYGRYLTIASSRDGDLPSNLQGIWQNRVGDANRVPWGSDYHMNVNLQMNYWPTYSTNMLECATPLVDYINALREPGEITAQTYFGVEEGQGFTAHTQNTPFGWTCPGWSFSWGWSPAALPWILQNVYEYYEYSGDVDYLRTNIYPLLKESALLYDNILMEYNGRLVSAPAYSPEHGPVSAGNTYEQSLIWQLYEDAITSAEVLGVDAAKVAEWKETQSKLNPIEIGDSGQIKEWYTETTLGSIGESGHRHMSHLLGLFPGDLINVDNAEYMDAAIVSLQERGYVSTGWGIGQRINAWARTGQGDSAYACIQSLFSGGMYPNLWDSHAPFQIDGNFGYTSGVAEMLMQSNVGYINILPALPSQWSSGNVDGLVARGNFEVGIAWENASPYQVKITSNNGGQVQVQSENLAMATVVDNKGNLVQYDVISANRIAFDTTKGSVYTISNIPEKGVTIAAPENITATRLDAENVELKWDQVNDEAVYRVYRQVDNGDLIVVAEDVDALTFTDDTANTVLGTITYRIQAVVHNGEETVEGEISSKVSVIDPTATKGMIDDRDAGITYTGSTWDTWGEPGLYNNTSTFVENPVGTETAEYTFSGTGIEIFATVNTDRGMVDVYIDGVLHGKADSYAATKANYTKIYSVTGLTSGVHTIKMVVTNEKNANSSKGKFEFDAFNVLDETTSVSDIQVTSASGITTLVIPDSTLKLVAQVTTAADNKKVTWSVDNEALGQIDKDGLLTIGDANGDITVTATSVIDPTASDSITIKIRISDGSSEPSLDTGTIYEFNSPGDSMLCNPAMTWTGTGWGPWAPESGYLSEDKVDGMGVGNTVSFDFEGEKIEIYGAINPTFSNASVTIDGNAKENAEFYATTDTKGVCIATYDNLGGGEHTITITVNTNSTTGYTKVALDYLKVYQLISVPAVDKSQLQNTIISHSTKYPEQYTAESYAPFKVAYDAAVAVMNDDNATATEVANAKATLESEQLSLASIPIADIPSPEVDPSATISAIGVETTTLVLTWPEAKNVEYYEILKDAHKVGTTTDTSYRVTGLYPNTEYLFDVIAVNRAGKTAGVGPQITVKTLEEIDIEAPEPARNLCQDTTNPDNVTWKKSVSEDVDHYELWVNGSLAKKINSGNENYEVDVMSILMTIRESVTYKTTVSVIAVDGANNRSVPATISFTITKDEEEDPVADFVERLYRNVLQREPDAAGLSAWTEVLKLGQEDGAKVALGFFQSPEFIEQNLSNEDYVKLLYATLLGREADSAGLDAWVALLDEGMSKLYVFRGFAESMEFYDICQAYGIIRGNVPLTRPQDQNEGVTKFIVRCYRLCLGREADEGGLNEWCNQILTGKNTAKEAALGFVFSDELKDQNLSDEAYIKMLYKVFLDREADPVGLGSWLKVLSEGADRMEVFNGFADSVEFKEICEDYGIQ